MTEVKVFVRAGAKKEVVEGVLDGSLQIAVREPAAHNLANNRVRELVARYFGTTQSHVRITKGHHSPKKIISIST